ncbi:MAG: serine--tRNA ligase [Spirochaetaceae bacterium]|jgi:seryl-tRNA synthetase|uniref:Serine--tRNA ligase n=1 Tax=Sphaerochaeta halotolerans TaxID=2293840 RepID=A0A372MJD7_9SPIR|nr:serine--tRNA ligase [Sphaerochaeta halotolerans]MBG0766684.1 serine--tRNA ligase [Spirochaetaceae bacterium]RFU95426.1 serine--tRNA ligase [Sphaerochaeta halotolerans]
MIDLKEIKSRRDEIAENIRVRNMQVDIDAIIDLQEKRSALLRQVEELRSKRNENAKKMKGKLDSESRSTLIAEGKSLKESIAEIESSLSHIEEEFQKLARTIPNYAHPAAPVGKEDKDNTAIKFVGTPPQFSFKPLDHVQLAERLDLIDFDTATRVSGPKFYYLKREAVILQMALERYAMDIVIKKGFTPFITPDIAKEEILQGIGFNPRGEESNIYTIENTDTCLVGTAEITLGGYYANQILSKDQLPIKMAGLSHCFRREAGGAGQYSKGLYRVHQFSKLEMFIYCTSEESEAFHDEILSIEEEIFSGLGVAYRVVDTCTGDLGAPAYRKFDIEAWMPGRGEDGEYGEVTSTSNCTDYQARSLAIRYKDDEGKIQFPHMLNGTAIALSRAMVAVLENFQNEDGSITIPPILVPYTGFSKIEARS